VAPIAVPEKDSVASDASVSRHPVPVVVVVMIAVEVNDGVRH